jgi:hypothetical protein
MLRYLRFLPIVLIALAAQILAPIASCWAAAIAASDPLRSIEICHSDLGSPSGAADQGPSHHAQDGACSICCLPQANASFDAPRLIAFLVPHVDAAPVIWRDDAPGILRSRNRCNAQARAPPQLT